MVRMLQNGSQNAAPAKSRNANFLVPLPCESEDANYDLNNDTRRAAINLSIEPGRKSEQINSKNHVKNNTGVQWAANFRIPNYAVFPNNGSHDCNVAELSAPIVYMNSSVTTPPDQDQDVFLPKSSQICSDHMIHELAFSLGDLTSQKNQAMKILMPHYIFESAGDSGSLAPPTPPTIAKSSSMPKLGFVLPASCPPCTFLAS
ncbi:hypothetical protein Nepgr_000484 [Nepenthes gracilis]|uniref:Uncharacterized protein n=1 Tax=Nepenthes gracilis TaxID=150966 RepID=A0AAD3P4J4_NEPGR|nr:hypothetical protein Nepgr_000484 [Nepenthes gracilis]